MSLDDLLTKFLNKSKSIYSRVINMSIAFPNQI